MLPKRHNLFTVGSVHFIKGASDALIGDPRNVRRVGKHSLPTKANIEQSIIPFDVRRFVQQLNHLAHFVLSFVGRFAIVINCKVAQQNFTDISANIFFTTAGTFNDLAHSRAKVLA